MSAQEKPKVVLRMHSVPCPVCGDASPGETYWQGPDLERGIGHDCAELEHRLFRLTSCPTCAHVFMNPRPVDADVDKIYEEDTYYAYEDYADNALTRFYKARNRGFYKAAIQALGPAGADGVRRILDVGCGNGFKLDALASGVSDPKETHAVEFSPGVLEQLRRRGHVTHLGGYDATTIPRDTFDIVSSSHVIEHVVDPVDFVRSLARYAKPGGVVVIDTPNRDALDAKLFRRGTWGGIGAPQHLHLFDRATLENLVRREGLEVVDVVFQPSAVFWLMSAQATLLMAGHRDAAMWFPIRTIKQQRASLRDVMMLSAFTIVDAVARRVSGTGPDMRLIARRPHAAARA